MRRTAIGILIGAVAILLLSCGKNKEPDRYQDRFRIEKVETHVFVITDRDTGIEYLAVEGSGISVLYDNDGSIRVANGWRDNDGL